MGSSAFWGKAFTFISLSPCVFEMQGKKNYHEKFMSLGARAKSVREQNPQLPDPAVIT